ncbi:MAG: hypothetical protein GTN80_11770 [Nitrososphaeria archaeon]|nr:hypothetical protein [Nitrososphaeria archaeon]NIQ34294.1 hypothetical protein [Nitrososphaeria archaeon]
MSGRGWFSTTGRTHHKRGTSCVFFYFACTKIAENLRKSGIPAVISYSACPHLCNWTLYNVLHYFSQREWNVPAVFIHLPLLPQQVPPNIPSSVVQQCTPSLPLEVMLKGLQIAIKTISETLYTS